MSRTDIVEAGQSQSADPIQQARALAEMPPGMALMKMQNDQIQALAVAQPRSLPVVLKNLKEQLEVAPEFAAKAVYSKPVGRENDKCIHCDSDIYRKKGKPANFVPDACPVCGEGGDWLKRGEMKFAEGLSIHAAETIAEAYKYNHIETDAEDVDDRHAKITAVFVDLQNGRIRRGSRTLSKFWTKRNGESTKYDDTRFWETVVPAAQSRLLREVILRSLPAGLKAELEKAARAATEKALDKETIKAIIENFAVKGATLEQLERFLTRACKQWTTADRRRLAGVWTAIEDGDTTIHELFADAQPDDGGDGQASSAPSAERLADEARLQEICNESGVPPRRAKKLVSDALGQDDPFAWIRLQIDGDSAFGGGDEPADDADADQHPEDQAEIVPDDESQLRDESHQASKAATKPTAGKTTPAKPGKGRNGQSGASDGESAEVPDKANTAPNDKTLF